MKKIFLLAIAGALIYSFVNAQGVQIQNDNEQQTGSIYVPEVHFTDTEGTKLFTFRQNPDGSVFMTDYAVSETDIVDGLENKQDVVVEKHQSYERKQTIIGPQYKKIVHFKDGQLEMTVTDVNTDKLLYKLVGSNEMVHLYGVDDTLIAEGQPEKMKIYDENAFADFKNIVEN